MSNSSIPSTTYVSILSGRTNCVVACDLDDAVSMKLEMLTTSLTTADGSSGNVQPL